jgi:CHASE1-domain containing sensor protein
MGALKMTTETDRLAEKQEAFRKLAERRTNAVLERIRILGNLANRAAYEYSDDEIRRIFAAIEQELRLTKSKFQATKKHTFRLD